MKKFLAVLMAGVMCLMMCVSAFAETENKLGGWTVAEETAVNEEARAAFDDAVADLVGAKLEPVAVMATQAVAGTNYCFLCTSTPVVPDAKCEYVMVYVYAGVNGENELLEIVNVTETSEELAGAWETAQDAAVTEELKAAFEKAAFVGSTLEPVAVVGTQVVSGTNYKVLCKVTPVVPDAEAHWAFVTLYESLNGECEVLEVNDCEVGLTQAE